MKNNMKKLILTAIIILSLTTSLSASADSGDFDVQFQNSPLPLFHNANFMPGDSVARYIQVTNNTSDAHSVYLWATNDNDEGLAEALYLTITQNSVIVYENTLAGLFSEDYIKLPDIAAGGSPEYILNIYFEDQSGDKYQEKSVGFDINIGFGEPGPEDNGPLMTYGGGGCGDGCYAVTPTPTPTETPTPDGRGGYNPPTPTPEPGGSQEDKFDGTTSGTIGGDDEKGVSESEGFTSTSQNNLLASIFGFLPCGYWLIILLLALMVLTALDRGYTLKRKIYMLVVLLAILILSIMGYIPCNWWIILIVALVLAYLLFRKRKKEY
jgi:hypothetical protein